MTDGPAEAGSYRLQVSPTRTAGLTGYLLAEVTTAAPGKPYWLELRLYRSAVTGHYYLHTVGRAAAGEDRPRLRRATRAREVLDLLLTERHGHPFLSGPARDLLDQAATVDPALIPVAAAVPEPSL